MSNTKKWVLFSLLIFLLVSLLIWAGRVVYSGKSIPQVDDYSSWSEEVIKEAGKIAVQDGGRLKPFATYAKVTMLKYHGDTSIKLQNKEGDEVKVGPVEWLLDILKRPQFALQMPTFQVENSDVIKAIGMETGKKSDHYSYNQIKTKREKLVELAGEYEERLQKEEKLDPTQEQTLALARNVRTYETLLTYFNFARTGVTLPAQEAGTEPTKIATSTFITTAGMIRETIQNAQEAGKQVPGHLLPVLEQVLNHSNDAKYGPSFIVGKGLVEEEEVSTWKTAGDSIMALFQGQEAEPDSTVTQIKLLEDIYASKEAGGDVLAKSIKTFNTYVAARLPEKKLTTMEREISYVKNNWFFSATFFCFVPAMIFACFSWLSPKGAFGAITAGSNAVFSTIGLVLVVIGITQRSLIMDRPPVGNLYDTIIFIAASVVLFALITELVTKWKIALGAAPFLGFFLLVLAWVYERGEGVDNMDPLIAVLRSNYWLTIHVLTITFGYAAGLIVWVFGCIYIFVKLLKLDVDNSKLTRSITRMTYGLICFTLLLSLIGTVLGGIWANDSWGRFWGWDPKENGALMIVLWTLFILHARAGGILREWGIHMAAIITGPIIVFSWWHVNLLGVGLHSYGFSDSKATAVNLFYVVNLVILFIGFFAMPQKKKKKAAIA